MPECSEPIAQSDEFYVIIRSKGRRICHGFPSISLRESARFDQSASARFCRRRCKRTKAASVPKITVKDTAVTDVPSA